MSGTAVPAPPFNEVVLTRPVASWELVVVRVAECAVSVVLAVLPRRSYSVVLVGSWAGLVPPPVMPAAGPVEQTRSDHSGLPLHAPVPMPAAGQYMATVAKLV
ncbi:hypothetical protein OG223_51580 [Streptomyces sp. NBC_01478]|uniref:hypothetical protein n=1 Tax=Streptomyces sp. NBC_01478 TaxID=2903882 RepID=UPI002E306B91|nr:hypothetical protein [Streptomyces sp. NBC_01478]